MGVGWGWGVVTLTFTRASPNLIIFALILKLHKKKSCFTEKMRTETAPDELLGNSITFNP